MNNNDIFKKLRVALMLRDEQIVEILQLVDFRITKSELGAFFRNPEHPNYMECGDQVLRNFLNGLVIYLRGTKENPTNPSDIISKNRESAKGAVKVQPKSTEAKKPQAKQKPSGPSQKRPEKKPAKIQIVEKVRYNNGKNKKG